MAQNISLNKIQKVRRKQDDRMLKHLSMSDRRYQQRMRQQIMDDPLFLAV